MTRSFSRTTSVLALILAGGLGASAFAQDAATADGTTTEAPSAETATTDAPAATAPAPAAGAAPADGVGDPMNRPGNDDTVPTAGSYAFDPAHSQIVYSYDHMGFSTSHGFVNGVEGTITLDPADVASATVEASFPLDALRTIDAELDQHIMGPDFFNVTGDAPAVTFTSTSVEAGDDNEARVTGDLTLNGVTKPVTLEVEFEGAGLDPMTQAETVGFSAEGEIRRSEFNLGAFVPAVSDEIEFEINVEAKKDG